MFRSTVKKNILGTAHHATPPATPFVSGTPQPPQEDATATKPKKPKNFYQK